MIRLIIPIFRIWYQPAGQVGIDCRGCGSSVSADGLPFDPLLPFCGVSAGGFPRFWLCTALPCWPNRWRNEAQVPQTHRRWLPLSNRISTFPPRVDSRSWS